MDALTAGLFIGASLFSSLYSSKNQAKIEEANTKLNIEQQRLQVSESAYERSKQFRQTMSENLALAGLGIGGVSGLRGINSRNIADYEADRAALGRQQDFLNVSENVSRATTKTNRFSRDFNSLVSAASLASDLGIFAAKPAKKGKLK